MADEPQSTAQVLVGLSFDDEFRAREFLTAAQRLESKDRLVLEDAVIVTRSAEGKTVVKETTDIQPKSAAFSGAVWAGLFGLILGGPVGWLAGTAIGAGAGATTAKLVDIGIPDDWVHWFRDAVRPGQTTLALLVRDLDRNALVEEAGRFTGAELVYANLDDDTLDRVSEALSE
jgi:uncharacterized membrane protein